jgi:hypothetical protein
MSMLVRFAPQTMSSDLYDQTISKLEEGGDFPPDGLEYHVCFGKDGELAVSEIWESQEKFEKFGERLMPILEEVGIDPGQPTVLDVHNQIKP